MKIRVVPTITLTMLLGTFTANGMIFPPNNLHLEDNPSALANMSEQEFDDLIDEVKEVYSPIVKKLGGRLTFEKDWDSSQVNAFARRGSFNKWVVAMFGGLEDRK